MTAKEYMLQIKTLNSMISNVEDEIRDIRESAYTIRSAWPDGQPHDTGTTDPVGAQAAKLADQLTTAEQTYIRYQIELRRKRDEIIAVINQVQRPEHNRLLYLRYVECKTWEQIAVEMNYTYQNVAGPLHGRALQAVDKIIKE